ncbi:MAG: lipoate--protein ligase [Armatimonadetes bacterium]|nr:lipoate--protein ligase [Candidatus Hippobium faecium]
MYYIYNQSTDPYYNMAVEEYILDYIKKDIFMLWQNQNAIIIGKNQNTLSEIDYNFAKEHNISVVRRLSGGGAVYHDLGNVNFTFVTDYNRDFFSEFDFFTKPVIDTLAELGIKAELQGRNDISIEGRKFSGNSQTVRNNRILHHGTIMLDVNVDILSKGLFVRKEKIESKGIKSVRKRVTNINDHLSSPISPKDFISLLAENVRRNNPDITDYELTDDDRKKIISLADTKYRTWQWNFGESPAYNIKKQVKLPGGLVDIYIQTEKGIIKNFELYGDFFGEGDIKEFCKKFIGKKHCYDDICQILKEEEAGKYIYTLKNIEAFAREMF